MMERTYDVTIHNPRDIFKGRTTAEKPEDAANWYIDAAEIGAKVLVESESMGVYKFLVVGSKEVVEDK